jgi:hypothetical protein
MERPLAIRGIGQWRRSAAKVSGERVRSGGIVSCGFGDMLFSGCSTSRVSLLRAWGRRRHSRTVATRPCAVAGLGT